MEPGESRDKLLLIEYETSGQHDEPACLAGLEPLPLKKNPLNRTVYTGLHFSYLWPVSMPLVFMVYSNVGLYIVALDFAPFFNE